MPLKLCCQKRGSLGGIRFPVRGWRKLKLFPLLLGDYVGAEQ
jgi:hypothetical protein